MTEPAMEKAVSKLHKTAQRSLKRALRADEPVQLVISGQSHSVLIATDRRAFIFKKGVSSGSMFGSQFVSWDYATIGGIEVKHGLASQAIVLEVPGVAPVTGTGQMDSGPNSAWEAPNALMLGKGVDAERGVTILRALIAQHRREQMPAPPPTTPVGPTPDPIDQIRRLGELRDQGLISTEEFEAKKRQLLGL